MPKIFVIHSDTDEVWVFANRPAAEAFAAELYEKRDFGSYPVGERRLYYTADEAAGRVVYPEPAAKP